MEEAIVEALHLRTKQARSIRLLDRCGRAMCISRWSELLSAGAEEGLEHLKMQHRRQEKIFNEHESAVEEVSRALQASAESTKYAKPAN